MLPKKKSYDYTMVAGATPKCDIGQINLLVNCLMGTSIGTIVFTYASASASFFKSHLQKSVLQP